MSAEWDWQPAIVAAVTAVFMEQLRFTVHPRAAVESSAERVSEALIPLQWGSASFFLTLRMPLLTAAAVHARLGAGSIDETDVVGLEETVSESANLIAGRLAGTIASTDGHLEIGIPVARMVTVNEPLMDACSWSFDTGWLSVRIAALP